MWIRGAGSNAKVINDTKYSNKMQNKIDDLIFKLDRELISINKIVIKNITNV